jgi:hypothetical protein
VDLIVIDGSQPSRFEAHAEAWRGIRLRHAPPDPAYPCLNGKVAGVRTGIAQAAFEHVVIADDDVRYDLDSLARVDALLDHADAVRPQNYFDPCSWHAQWDTARTLINRCIARDWPGTFGLRRSTFIRMDGYDGDVLFENLELVRSVKASGGTVVSPLDLYVRRRPPSTRHFLSQRVRQAYDEFARPPVFAVWLAIAPVMILTAVLTGLRQALVVAALMAATAIIMAEIGRQKAGGSRVFPLCATFLAPLWVAERAITSWMAIVARVRGGMPYGGVVIARAATPRPRARSAA